MDQGIIDKLHEIEIQLARLVSNFESERGTIARLSDDIVRLRKDFESQLGKIEGVLIGDEGEGLRTRVSLIEDTVKGWQKQAAVIWAAITGVVIKVIFDIIKGAK